MRVTAYKAEDVLKKTSEELKAVVQKHLDEYLKRLEEM